MKDYLRWSLRQLYLLFFWPTQYMREVAGSEPDQAKLQWSAPFRYLMRLFPGIVVLIASVTLIVGCVCEVSGITFYWGNMGLGIMSGVMIGLAYGATFGVASGLTGGVIGGLVGGVMGGSSDNVMDGVPFGVAVAVIGSVAGRLSNVIAGDATSHMGRGLIGCLAGGVAFFVTGNVTDYVAGDGTFNASLASSLAGLVGMSIIAGLLLGFLVTPAVWLIQFPLITYPFDVVLAIATYYVGRRRPYVATRIWRWCPVAWNEVIWLPLPFVSSLLILLVRQEREEGFRQIAFVAAERKLQRRVAVAALVEVAVSDLKARSLSELSDISDKLG